MLFVVRAQNFLLAFIAVLSSSAAVLFPTRASAQDLIVDGTTITLGGFHTYNNIEVINGGHIEVTPFDGSDRKNTGNLILQANRIYVDATSSVSARGAGYFTERCGDGSGPSANSGGAGGCALRDSGGGGAHFGRGGRGTKDCFIVAPVDSCQFPEEFEEDCGNSLSGDGTSCTSTSNCRNNDGLPSNAGEASWHSVWDFEFGGSGGDKGCRDGDGFGSQPLVAGFGGGRIALGGVNAQQSGEVIIEGEVSADGKRGCGTGNDSAGGGAGGSVLVAGDSITIEPTAVISAAGGLGGDTRAGANGQPDSADCPANAQTSGTCDDCGGGGGGGVVSVQSRMASISSQATFDVAGAVGGTCDICQGEAGGGAGELQINIRYRGEFCDGFDNDFDDKIDEGLGTIDCGLGPCQQRLPACTNGEPTECAPDTMMSSEACLEQTSCNAPRVAVILDTSASMLQDLAGIATFGDGSAEHPGLDTDGDSFSNDSRLFLAKEALAQVISNFPEVDFSLARYHQDTAADQSCQLATWIECAGIFATYDEPTDNTGPVQCSVPINSTDSVTVRRDSTGEECINYAGSCGGPRAGADILAGFGSDPVNVVRWLDGRETNFSADETEGNYCNHASGGDCELRATGPTPLEGALEALEDYLVPIRTTDPCASGCRDYTTILVTDGAESCGGDPASAADELFSNHNVPVNVVAVSVKADEEASLNQIAASGGTSSATFVNNPADLVPVLTTIVAGAIKFEVCNGLDDDCDGNIDEGFPGLGNACNDGKLGACLGRGTITCRDDESGTECRIDNPGQSPDEETCNEADDDCDGLIDEMLVCTGSCVPTGPEVCDGVDNDCNGLIDETDPLLNMPCGEAIGQCTQGSWKCVGGTLECFGGVKPRDEICNGLDDDCDGEADELAPCPGESACIYGVCREPCLDGEFPCRAGLQCVVVPEFEDRFCVVTACSQCSSQEVCENDECVDRCEGVECEENEVCSFGQCRDCRATGCVSGLICSEGACIESPCKNVVCDAGESCYSGVCRTDCDERECSAGESCGVSGNCEPELCPPGRCQAGQACVEGSCRENPCLTTRCGLGEACSPALGCITDPCALTDCSSGRVCEVTSSGDALCVSSDSEVANAWVSASGSGGFIGDCSVRRSPPDWPVGLGFVVLLGLVRRRRT